MTVIYVAIGGAIGAVLRYVVVQAVSFPYGTMLVNVLGSFLIGLVLILLAEKGLDRFQPLVMTGVLGGFTTYSTFSLDTLRMFESGQIAGALTYSVGTLLLCLAACAAGLWLGRMA